MAPFPLRPRRSSHCRSKLPCGGARASGALVVLVAVQVLVLGLYRPPVLKLPLLPIRPRRSSRCRSILPCARSRASGALVVLVAVQVSVLGLYLPPVLKKLLPVIRPRRSSRCRSRLPCDRLAHRAHWWCWWLSKYQCWDCISRQCSNTPQPYTPPQTIISLPVQTAVWTCSRLGRIGGAGWLSRCCPCNPPTELLLLEAYRLTVLPAVVSAALR